MTNHDNSGSALIDVSSDSIGIPIFAALAPKRGCASADIRQNGAAKTVTAAISQLGS